MAEASVAPRPMSVTLEQVGAAAFAAEAASGGTVVIDGAPAIGGEGRGMRPMELLLTAIASCSAMDVVSILRKQREPLEHLRIEIEGARADSTPSPFTRVRIVFVARGSVDEHKLRRAVSLSVEKYCSVRATMSGDVDVQWDARLE
ncbi:MAG: OsmC family protein [Myxococcota bacterium]|nr:OsmC family protein [Myxococcota bacterium]